MNAATTARYILIADDDLDDIELLTTALKDTASEVVVQVADNGKSVMEQLRNVQAQAGAAPCVLVMDMNMPKMDGRETVVALKGADQFKNLPILLFSTSKNKTDELFAEKWGIRYFQKPDTVQGLNDVAKMIIAICGEKP